MGDKCKCVDVCTHTGVCDTANNFHFVADRCDCVENCPESSAYVQPIERYYAKGTDIQVHFCGLHKPEASRLLLVPATHRKCSGYAVGGGEDETMTSPVCKTDE